ncbi:MAG TPA: RidA family protein [Bryobacteraceae bacterium]|nr:RidA family protein [Bryobacteraceae bacterium]
MLRIQLVPKLVLTAVLLVALSYAASSSQKKVINPRNWPSTMPFSSAIQFGDTLYISGGTGTDPKTGKVPDNFEDEVRVCLNGLHGVLKSAGMDYDDVVSVQIYLTDMNLFQRMNAVYMQVFQNPRPTRTAVGVTRLAAAGAHMEMTVTARK